MWSSTQYRTAISLTSSAGPFDRLGRAMSRRHGVQPPQAAYRTRPAGGRPKQTNHVALLRVPDAGDNGGAQSATTRKGRNLPELPPSS